LYDNDMSKVQRYLMQKWNIATALPVSHPFKVAYPYYRPYSPLDEDIQPEYWFDASDLTTITASGTALTTWSNKGSRVGSNITVVLGTARTGTVTQNGMNLISLSNGTRLQFSGTFPNQPRARFIAFKPIVEPGTSNIEFYRRGTSTTGGFDLLRSEPTGTGSGRVSEQAQGVVTNIQTTGDVPPLNTFGIISCYNATNSASNVVLNTSLNHASFLISSNAASYSTSTASNFINYNGGQQLGEWLSYNTDLPSGHQGRIHRYLFWKWDATNINSGGTRRFPTLSPIFNPRTEMSNCSIWIDAADPSTVILTNGFVTSIRNKGTGQSSLTGGNGFTYNETKFNGTYPSFYNSNTTGTNLLCSGSPALNQPFTFFIVGSRDNQTGTTSNYLVDGTSTTRASVLGVPAGTLRMGTDVCLNLTSVTLTNGFIGTFQFNTTTSIAYLNGTSNIAGSAGTGSTSNIRIGNSTSSNEPWNGHICEAIMYTVASTLPQIQRVEGYLAHKWGLVARLPSTHPYRKFRP
jgi:hypothetical protein